MAWLHVHFNSEVLGMPVPMEVLLPQHKSGGSRKIKYSGPYQTLYLLHGMGEDHTAWMRRTSIERYVEELPLAVVMPAAHLGWYTDMAYGKDYFKFITEELPVLCERMFNLSGAREDRFIAGSSMGGYGAMKAGLVAADTFCAAAAFSGVMDVIEAYDQIDKGLAEDIFGSKNDIKGSVNDLFSNAEKLASSDNKRTHLYMWCGTEDPLYDANVKFRDHVLKLGLPLTYEESTGDHQWKYWDRCIERILEWLPLKKSNEE